MNNFPPTVTVLDSAVELGQEISVLGRFSVSDIDPNPQFTRFRFRDSSTSPQSGYFKFRGQVWQQGLVLEVSAADLADVTYHAGAIISSELVTIEAFDGVFWSTPAAGTFFSVVPNITPPVVEGSNLVVTALETVNVGDFISAYDPDGYPILEYMFIDGINDPNGGYFSLFGTAMPSVVWFTVQPDELPFLKYHGNQFGTSEPIAVLARDQQAYSALTFFDAITTPNNFNPTVVANNVELVVGERIPLEEMFTFSDLDGNTLKTVEVRDLGVAATSGYFELDGIPVTGGQAFSVAGNQLSRVNYVAGSLFGAESFQVQVFDGQRLSSVATGLATTNEAIDVAPDRIQMLDSFELVRMFDLLNITTSISPISYEIIDLNTAPTSARILVNGSEMPAGQVHVVSSTDFSQTFIRGGADDLGRSFDEFLVRVNNGFNKSAWTKLNVSTDPVNEEAVLGLGFWNFTTPKLELTYNFPASVPQYYCTLDLEECNNNSVLANPEMRAAIRAVMDEIETVIDVTFREVSATTLSDIPFMLTSDSDMGLLGYSYGPGDKAVFDPRGDIWGNSNSPSLPDSEPGQTGFATWIHEMGHSLGLEHSFSGTAILPGSMENNRYSIMSYDRVFFDGNGQPIEPRTFQLYDIMALQTLYGANPTFRAGNTQIRIDPNSPIPQTVYDSGGMDSLNFNNHVVGVTVDLRQGQFSSVGNQVNNVAIAWGTDIENARGGSGFDILRGNELNNILMGNAGNDTLQGRDGQDVLRGMAGNDTYIWGIGDGFDVIDEDFGAGRDEIRVQLFDDYDFGQSTLQEIFTFRRLGNDLRIDLNLDGPASEGGMRISNMAFGKNRVETLSLYDLGGNQIGPNISLVSIFTGASASSQQFMLTSNTSRYGNLAVPIT